MEGAQTCKKKLHLKRTTLDNRASHPLLLSRPLTNHGSKKKSSSVEMKREQLPVDFIDPLLNTGSEEAIQSNKIQDEALIKESKIQWRKLLTSSTEENAKVEHCRITVPQPLYELLHSKIANSDRGPSTSSSFEARLEWLEGKSQGNDYNEELSHLEFLSFMEACNQYLSKSWMEDHRVQVVKLAIQLAKMLSPEDIHGKQYQCVFFNVVDLITFYGTLVYDRLVSKCPQLKINFSYDDVSPQAKELCKNWLFKVASIRELVPRFYLETSMLRCYKFSCDYNGFTAILERLTLMVRGFGDPISAAYARLYLVFTADQTLGHFSPKMVRDTAQHNYEELLRSLSNRSLDKSAIRLLETPIRWLVKAQTFGLGETSAEYDAVLQKCINEFDSISNCYVVLAPLLDILSPSVIRNDLTRLAHVVLTIQCEESSHEMQILKAYLYLLLRCADTLPQSMRNETMPKIVRKCWQHLAEHSLRIVPKDTLECSKVILKLWLKLDQKERMNKTLGSLMTLKASNGQQLIHYGTLDSRSKDTIKDMLILALQAHFSNVHASTKKIPELVESQGLSNFMPLFDCLSHAQQVETAKFALDNYPSLNKEIPRSWMHSSLLRFAKVLASSVNALTISDEVRQISTLICRAIDAIDRDRQDEPERKLKFYTECRAIFKNIEPVLQRLIFMALNLALSVKQKSTKNLIKVGGFTQACVAFSFITIPSLLNVYSRLQLYLLTAQVAYQCHCIGQGESSLQAILTMLEKGLLESRQDSVTKSSLLKDFLPSFLSFGLVVPFKKNDENSMTDLSYTKIVKRTLKSATKLSSDSSPDQSTLAILYTKAIQLLCAAGNADKKCSYEIDGLPPSDVLWYDEIASTASQAEEMCKDLVPMIQSRIDFLLEQNASTQGCYVGVFLLLCLKTCCPSSPFIEEAMASVWRRVEEHAQHMDNKTLFLWKHVQSL